MTSRERLIRIFQGKPVDRPAVRLWGIEPGQNLLHPAYKPVYDLAIESTDILLITRLSGFNLYWGESAEKIIETIEIPTDSEEWSDIVTKIHLSNGELKSIFIKSKIGKPGYQKEYLLKELNDIKKLLAFPYKPYQFSDKLFYSMEKIIGDCGLTMFGLDHAMYGLQSIIGSENFALWSIEYRDLISEAIDVFAKRIKEQVISVFESGLKPIFGWAGPELCIPPLMNQKDFDDFVFKFDKPLIDLIHEQGGYVWVHCHGKMQGVINKFLEMGVDVLNPIEPPPMGDLTLVQAFDIVDNRMGLEGNIETHDLMTASREKIIELVYEAIESGKGHRFILCASSGYMEWPFPENRYIENLLTYIKEGIQFNSRGVL